MQQKINDLSNLRLSAEVTKAIEHLKKLGYTKKTLVNYKSAWDLFLTFVQQNKQKEEHFTVLAHRFLETQGILELQQQSALTFRQRHLRTAMRVLTEFTLHQCIQRRSKVDKKIKLSSQLKIELDEFLQFRLTHVHSRPGTIDARKRDVTRFLHFIESHGLFSIIEIQHIEMALLSFSDIAVMITISLQRT